MEENLRQLVRKEFGDSMDDSLVFADVAERNEHLRRLGCADVFLDTPSYNAHTLGCDALYMGVPMISLLRKLPDADDDDDKCNSFADVDMRVGNDFSEGKSSLARLISTEKLASRVGASLLEAVGLGDLVFPDMSQYEDAMVKCAMDEDWFGSLCERLDALKDSSPLFDTQRWVRNLETAFQEIMLSDSEGRTTLPDIVVEDNDS